MQSMALNLGLLLLLPFTSLSQFARLTTPATSEVPGASSRQLFAVRGQIVTLKQQSKGMISITVKPPQDFSEVTVVARENDQVGTAASHDSGVDLLGFLGSDESHDEGITAAELHEGDIVSVIYDPQSQNRALEIYVH